MRKEKWGGEGKVYEEEEEERGEEVCLNLVADVITVRR